MSTTAFPKLLLALGVLGLALVLVSIYSVDHVNSISRKVPMMMEDLRAATHETWSSLQEQASTSASAWSQTLLSSGFFTSTSTFSSNSLLQDFSSDAKRALSVPSVALSTALFPTLAHDEVLSPLSVSLALSVLQEGAINGAAQELQQLLSIDSSSNTHVLLSQLFALNRSENVRVRNELFVNKHAVHFLNKGFVSRAKSLGVTIDASYDFEKDKSVLPRVLDTRWNAEWKSFAMKENDYRFSKFMKPTAHVVVVSLMQFRSRWALPMINPYNQFLNFTQSTGQQRSIAALVSEEPMPYTPFAQNAFFKLFELSLMETEFRMGFVVPLTHLAGHVQRLQLVRANASQLMDLIQSLQPFERVFPNRVATVRIPKMRMDSVHRLAPKAMAGKALGLKSLVTASVDGSKSVFEPIAKKGFLISEFVHEIHMSVDEFGVNVPRKLATAEQQPQRSSAALLRQSTTQTLMTLSDSLRKRSVGNGDTGSSADDGAIVMSAEHTFLFYIRHEPTGALVFVGEFDG